jgi:WD40 repeat protein
MFAQSVCATADRPAQVEYSIVGTLRLLEAVSGAERHQGEVYSCTFTRDGAFLLSAGWDGHLRLWDAAAGTTLTSLSASPKPLSCCAFTPDAKCWLSGSMEGLLSIWDGASSQTLTSFVAHTRPISGICFSPDGMTLATSSWDRTIVVRKPGKEREGRVLAGHLDIVAGCRFTVDGQQIVSWSYDGTIRLWDLNLGKDLATLAGHEDRVTTIALSPDGRWLLSGGRDAMVRLWDLEAQSELAAMNVGAEVRGCFCLLDGESAVVADAAGRLFLVSLPSFEMQSQLTTPYRVMCGDLSPAGSALALGGEDGLVHFVAVEGFEDVSLVVTARENLREGATMLDRFFGKTRMTRMYEYTCPACRNVAEVATLPAQPVSCPRCRRRLRVNGRVPVLQA